MTTRPQAWLVVGAASVKPNSLPLRCMIARMKALFLILLLLLLISGGMKVAGAQIPVLDYPIGPMTGPLFHPHVELVPGSLGANGHPIEIPLH